MDRRKRRGRRNISQFGPLPTSAWAFTSLVPGGRTGRQNGNFPLGAFRFLHPCDHPVSPANSQPHLLFHAFLPRLWEHSKEIEPFIASSKPAWENVFPTRKFPRKRKVLSLYPSPISELLICPRSEGSRMTFYVLSGSGSPSEVRSCRRILVRERLFNNPAKACRILRRKSTLIKVNV